MWYWISCYLVGHDYSVHCESGAIYLRCANCGRRSQGWHLHEQPDQMAHDRVNAHSPVLAPARHH